MTSSELFEKGSITLRVRKTVVAIVLSKYHKPNKVLRSVPLDQIEQESAAVLQLLGSYRRGHEKWNVFISSTLPKIRRKREEEARLLSYEEISRSLSDVAWSLKKHRERDRNGHHGGRELAVSIWLAWQDIRPTISTSTYWGVSEEMAKAGLGLKTGKK
jgi:hypothetical protein